VTPRTRRPHAPPPQARKERSSKRRRRSRSRDRDRRRRHRSHSRERGGGGSSGAARQKMALLDALRAERVAREEGERARARAAVNAGRAPTKSFYQSFGFADRLKAHGAPPPRRR
jgi:hypothetical protein